MISGRRWRKRHSEIPACSFDHWGCPPPGGGPSSSLQRPVEGAIPSPSALKASAGFPDRRGSGAVYPEQLGTQRSSGIYYPPACRFDGGREQSVEPARNHRPVILPNPEGGLCASLSAWRPSLRISERPGAPVSQITAGVESEDKSVLFGFHRIDPEINCQGLSDTQYQSPAKCHNESWAGCQERPPGCSYSFIFKGLVPGNRAQS